MLESILTALSILFGVIAFMLRQLIMYFKKVSKDISEVKATTALIKAEFKGSHALLNQKFDFLDIRISRIENFKPTDNKNKM